MKKFAKMSLVAAVAVAGMASTVSAKDLSEAIQGVDFSGSVTYRFDERNSDPKGDAGRSSSANSYKIVTNTKVPVNDDVTLNTQINVYASDKTTDAAAVNAAVEAREIYFTYTGVSNTAIKVGKQAVDTPFTDAHDYISKTGEQAGNGIAATVTAGPVVVGAQYFTNNDFSADDNSGDIVEVSLSAKAGPVNLTGSYMNISESGDTQENGWSAYYLAASGKVAGWSLAASFAAAEEEQSGAGDLETDLIKLTAKGKIGSVGVKAGYASNSEDDDNVNLTWDVDAKADYLVWSSKSAGRADYDGFYVGADMNVAPKVNVAVVYADSDWTESAGATDKEFTELIGQVAYKMSKNFSTYVRYATQTEETNGTEVDYNRGRIQIKYDF